MKKSICQNRNVISCCANRNKMKDFNAKMENLSKNEICQTRPNTLNRIRPNLVLKLGILCFGKGRES